VDFMTMSIADRLRAGPVLGAEGYVFELERRGHIKAGPFVPEVVLDYPDAVRELHREFLRAGADVMVALTYYTHREKLRDVGREVPASKYSPSMELHPMFRADVAARNAAFLHSWTA
jgi:S-methylmethionine-dependent homocysteine/selenocysteine methylase